MQVPPFLHGAELHRSPSAENNTHREECLVERQQKVTYTIKHTLMIRYCDIPNICVLYYYYHCYRYRHFNYYYC